MIELIQFRLKETQDEPFVFNSWLQSNRNRHNNMPTSDYYAHYKKIVTDIMYKSKVVVACDPENPDFIFGYLVIRPIDDVPILQYSYVKKPFRRFGLFKKLCENQGIDLKEPVIVTVRPPDFMKYLMVYRPDLKSI